VQPCDVNIAGCAEPLHACELMRHSCCWLCLRSGVSYDPRASHTWHAVAPPATSIDQVLRAGPGASAAAAAPGHISDSVPTRFFSCPGAADFKVRGPDYLADKRKARAPPLAPPVTLTRTPRALCSNARHQRLRRAGRTRRSAHNCAGPAHGQEPGILRRRARALRERVCAPSVRARLKRAVGCEQVLPERPECRLASVNLVSVAEPTFHIARFLPSIRDSPAPLTFVWHVRARGPARPLVRPPARARSCAWCFQRRSTWSAACRPCTPCSQSCHACA